jgi:site-specific DNA recombinase
MKPESDWVLTSVESIVSEELWEQCNFILRDMHNGRKRPAKKPVHLFAGLAYCFCGQKMYVPSNTPKYICYSCRNKIPVTDLEGVFHEQLKSFFFSSTDITAYLDQADQTIKEKQKLLGTLECDAQKSQREMDKLYNLYLADEISRDGFGARHRPLEERVKQLTDQIPCLQGEIDFLKVQYLSSDEIFTEAKDVYSRWPELEQAEKRKIIENILEKIVIGKEDVSISLCYLPSSAEIMTERQHIPRDSWPPQA